MKKIIPLTLAFLAVLGGALFVMMSRPAPEPGVFLPYLDEGSLQLHIRRADLVMDWLLDVDEFLRSDDLPPSGASDLIPFLGRGALQVGVDVLDGLSDRFFLALEVIEVPKALELSQVIRDEVVRRGGRAMPLKASLPEDMTPLFVLTKDDSDSYWGLWRRGAGSVILVSSSLQDLTSMVPEGELPLRWTSGPDWARLSFPHGISSDVPGFSSELSLSLSDERVLLSSWNNGDEIFLSQERVEALENMEELPLYGGGELAAIAAWTGLLAKGSSREALDLFLDEEGRFIVDDLISLTEHIGLEWDEVMSALEGRMSVVLGSSASGLMGPMPGGYVLLEGVSPDIGKKIVDWVAPLNLPFGAGPLKKAGWDGGLSCRIPLTAVLAYGPEGLLAGIVDPDNLDRRPSVPERISDSVKKARHVALAVDVRRLLDVIETYRSMASFIDQDLSSILGSTMELLSPWDRFELSTPSLGRFELSLYRLQN